MALFTNSISGKDKCKKLREIRLKIAEANGIDYEPELCMHEGPCHGTCPLCDAEVAFLDRELQAKRKRGEEIVINGIAAEDIICSQYSVDEDNGEWIEFDSDGSEGGLHFGDVSISELDLSVRSYNVLLRAGYTSVDELIDLPDEALRKIRNMGEKCIQEILEKLRIYKEGKL